MQRKLLTAVFALCVMIPFPVQAHAEQIKLNSGKMYSGVITGHSDLEVEMNTENGPVLVPYSLIEQIIPEADDSTIRYVMMDDLQKRFEKVKAKEKKKHVYASSSNDDKVEFYMTSWCPYCKKMEQFMRENKIRYVKYNIEYDRAAHSRYQDLGGGGVPLIKAGDIIIKGYNPSAVLRAVK